MLAEHVSQDGLEVLGHLGLLRDGAVVLYGQDHWVPGGGGTKSFVNELDMRKILILPFSEAQGIIHSTQRDIIPTFCCRNVSSKTSSSLGLASSQCKRGRERGGGSEREREREITERERDHREREKIQSLFSRRSSEGVLLDGGDDILEEDLGGECVAVEDDWLPIIPIPAVHCKWSHRQLVHTTWSMY